jgi:hypothetical protein
MVNSWSLLYDELYGDDKMSEEELKDFAMNYKSNRQLIEEQEKRIKALEGYCTRLEGKLIGMMKVSELYSLDKK